MNNGAVQRNEIWKNCIDIKVFYVILDFCVVKSRMYTDVNQVLLKIKLKYTAQ